jgi:hypothetical protein
MHYDLGDNRIHSITLSKADRSDFEVCMLTADLGVADVNTFSSDRQAGIGLVGVTEI